MKKYIKNIIERLNIFKNRKNEKKYFLSSFLILRDEDPYIEEFILYHLIQGIEHFYIYDDRSKNKIEDIVPDYMKYITVIRIPQIDGKVINDRQTWALNNFHEKFGKESYWTIFTDVDEFIVPKKDENLKDFLKKHDNFDAIFFYMLDYGFGFNINTNYDLFVIDRFRHRTKTAFGLTKYVAKNEHISKPGIHFCLMKGNRKIVSPEGKEFENHFSDPFDKKNPKKISELLQLNHYHRKTYQEYLNKLSKGRPQHLGNDGNDYKFDEVTFEKFITMDIANNEIYDDSAIKFIPEMLNLRKNLNSIKKENYGEKDSKKSVNWFFTVNDNHEIHKEMSKRAVLSAEKWPNIEKFCIYYGNDQKYASFLRVHNVKIINHESSFIEEFDKLGDYGKTASGAFLRIDIPEIIIKNKLFEDEFYLYTDCDVIFLKDPSEELLKIKPKFFSASSQSAKVESYPFNSGVMWVNIKNMYETLSDFRNHIKKKNLLINSDFDQTALNDYYYGKYEFLDLKFNWKPYWGINEDAYILHFHGPKPLDVLKFENNLVMPEHYKSLLNKETFPFCKHYSSIYWEIMPETVKIFKIPDNFNWKSYINNYEDLQKAGIDNEEKAKEHWTLFGQNEGRSYK